MLALCWPYVGLMLGQHCANFACSEWSFLSQQHCQHPSYTCYISSPHLIHALCSAPLSITGNENAGHCLLTSRSPGLVQVLDAETDSVNDRHCPLTSLSPGLVQVLDTETDPVNDKHCPLTSLALVWYRYWMLRQTLSMTGIAFLHVSSLVWYR